MIEWGDVYKVATAMAPLYVALGLGYASVRWWRMFQPEDCDALNRFNCYFVFPFLTYHITSSVDPYNMNLRFLMGDVVAKAMVASALALWVTLGKSGSFSWAITSFSLSSLSNVLVVGAPLLEAMYGEEGELLLVQASVVQSLLWVPLVLFMLEFRRTAANLDSSDVQMDVEAAPSPKVMPSNYNSLLHLGSTMTEVGRKLGKNPNFYACGVALIWGLVSKRWDMEMPVIVEESILIMAKAGSGVAMFTMGVFMAQQKKLIGCGVRLTIYGMMLRFVGSPLTSALGALALGLRSNILRIVIFQAALPQGIIAFVLSQEYGLHADVISTAIFLGTIVSLPLLIGYFAILGLLH